jgi:hypothetical protein
MHRSPDPRYGLILPNPVVGADAAMMVDYAVAAEESGWDGVFLWDVLVNPPPPDALGKAGDPEPWDPDHFEDLIDPVITLAGIATVRNASFSEPGSSPLRGASRGRSPVTSRRSTVSPTGASCWGLVLGDARSSTNSALPGIRRSSARSTTRRWS